MKFIDLLDHTLVIAGEMKPGYGEDSYVSCICKDAILAGVFDGCGGAGSTRYAVYGNHTGAFMGSRIVSGVVHDWFNFNMTETSADTWNQDICANIKKALSTYKTASGPSRGMKGKMVKDFPTTAVFTVCTQMGKYFGGKIYWSGDSRGYILNTKGLHQVTTDDVHGEDAMSNLTNDGVLTNVISASEEFELHEMDFTITSPQIVICATDGCFNYLPSPMHFEYVILLCMQATESPKEWEELLTSKIREVTGDDHTMTITSFGYGDYANMKSNYAERTQYLKQTYIDVWETLSDEQKLEKWSQYQAEMN